MPRIHGDDGNPGFVPISFVPDTTDVITGPTTVTFTLMAPPGLTNPPLSLSFYESNNPPGPGTSSTQKAMLMEVLTLDNPPTPTWNSGVATFELLIDYSVVGMLSSNQSLFTVVAQITSDTSSSMGICSVALDFPAMCDPEDEDEDGDK